MRRAVVFVAIFVVLSVSLASGSWLVAALSGTITFVAGAVFDRFVEVDTESGAMRLRQRP